MAEILKQALINALQSPAFLGMLLTLVTLVIGIIVKHTKTKKDDEIFAMVLHAFNIAEKIIPDKSGPAWLQKSDLALKTFFTEYEKRKGQTPKEAILNEAKDTFAILARELKKK